MKFYVAGKWQDREYIKSIMEHLKKLGHEITCDWTTHSFDSKTGVTGTKEDIENFALEDIQGVKEADICIFLFGQEYVYRGALVELGLAIAFNKEIFIIGNKQDDCIFANLSYIKKFKSFSNILKYLKV